jgi:hypothetical protein
MGYMGVDGQFVGYVNPYLLLVLHCDVASKSAAPGRVVYWNTTASALRLPDGFQKKSQKRRLPGIDPVPGRFVDWDSST